MMDVSYFIGIGVLAVVCLTAAYFVLMLRAKVRRSLESLPDGDYVVTEEGTRETSQGTVHLLKVVEPESLKGHMIQVLPEKDEGSVEEESSSG